ncbi:MAG: long-chain fatty acid--CoA ligase [Halobacteriales archaeon]|nr:long-chain fatty acid--CoA ligase [Halobacteriales archaeon]
MFNLVNPMEDTVGEYPSETAVKHRRGGTEMTYEEFWDESGRFAAALRDSGVEPDERVAVYLPNLPEFVTAFVGVLRNGSVVVPLNPQYKAREIRHILADSGAKLVVTLPELVEEVRKVEDETDVREVVAVSSDTDDAVAYDYFLADDALETETRASDDIAAQPYTSGTTGDPKGVLLTHGNLSFVAEATPKVHDGIRTEDKMLGVLPLFHIYGMTVNMLATLYEGGSYHLMTEWDAGDALELIEEEGITILHGVPAMYNDLVNHPDADEYTFESVRFANAGGDSLPLDTIRRFEEEFGTKLMEGYGLTETAPTTHANSNDERRKGSIGKPLPGVESKVVDEEFEETPRVERGPVNFADGEHDYEDVVGEIVVSGPNVMKGYHGLPDANEDAFTEEDGKRWFHTGDLGYWDEDRFFYVVDREKHMIVTGGYNVYPREVEELLFEHPDVAEAAVVGVPDERKGETVKAYVVKQPDATVTSDEIREYCLENLAAYKHPREVEFVEELPRTASGKVQKFRLREE